MTEFDDVFETAKEVAEYACRLEAEAIDTIRKAHVLHQIAGSLRNLDDKLSTATQTIDKIREAFILARGPLRSRDIVRFLGSSVSRQRIYQLLAELKQEGEIDGFDGAWFPVAIQREGTRIRESAALDYETFRDNGYPARILRMMDLGVVYLKKDLIRHIQNRYPEISPGCFDSVLRTLKKKGAVTSPNWGSYVRARPFLEETDDK